MGNTKFKPCLLIQKIKFLNLTRKVDLRQILIFGQVQKYLINDTIQQNMSIKIQTNRRLQTKRFKNRCITNEHINFDCNINETSFSQIKQPIKGHDNTKSFNNQQFTSP